MQFLFGKYYRGDGGKVDTSRQSGHSKIKKKTKIGPKWTLSKFQKNIFFSNMFNLFLP